ncbi:CoA transferase [Alcaligenaceae bacterium]|nr:CoA transferase [Alcaligenaceae bacterium]
MTGPLNGIRIIDISTVLMAPYATQILGDMGADVIKVESPAGDLIRGIGPYRHAGMGAIFMNANRSKRSLVLDLKQAAGRDALLELCRHADLFIYNLRPQVMERLGLSYEQISAVNTRIIYVGMYGYGQDGPYAAKPAYDDLIQGAVGIPWLAHMNSGNEPTYVPTAIVDRGVALSAVGIINAALYHQLRTGNGQRIDIPMFETMAAFVLGDHLAGETFVPPIGPSGYQRMLVSDRRPYRTRDGYICLMAYSDRHWRELFQALGRGDEVLSDPRFSTIEKRTEHIGALYQELSSVLAMRTTAEWLELCETIDIPAMPLHTIDSLIQDPHLKATGFFSVVEHPTEGSIRHMAVPSQWSETQPLPSRHAPVLGEHSIEILREAGYTPEHIATLLEAGVSFVPSSP